MLISIVHVIPARTQLPLQLLLQKHLLLLVLHPELPVALLYFLTDLVYARSERALLAPLLSAQQRLSLLGRRGQLDQTVLVVDKLVGKRKHLLDYVIDGPHALDLVSHLHQSTTTTIFLLIGIRLINIVIRGSLLLSLQLLDVFGEARGLLNQLSHALLRPVPVRIIYKLEKDVKNATLDLFAISVGVQNVPQLQKELFFARLPLFLLQLKRAQLCSLRP